jgi:hypothetical protein
MLSKNAYLSASVSSMLSNMKPLFDFLSMTKMYANVGKARKLKMPVAVWV